MTDSLETIWHELAEQLRAFIRRRVTDDAEAEDILQDVFLKLARRGAKLPAPKKLPGWIFLVARNTIIDRYRTHKATVPLPESLALEADIRPEEHDGLCAAFRRMIRELPAPFREAIVLTELEGVSQVELAKRLGISVSGAKSRVQRGRRMLKETLVKCCQFEFDRRGGLANCQPRENSGCTECA